MSFLRASAADMGPGASSISDRRAALQREAQEREVLRQQELAAQRSPLNTPQERLRIWERLHSLSLPTSRTHKLVRVIAQQTDLTVSEVQEEQRRRAGGVDPIDPLSSHEGLR